MRRLLLVSILVAGCGDDGNRHIIDAPLGQPDGPNIDAAPAPITLTATRAGAPVANVKVYFQNADSHLVSATMTGTDGIASAVMDAGGFVTALDPFVLPAFGGPIANNLYTFAGVKPGDHLVLDQPASAQITINVTIPASTGVGVTTYSITTTCASDPVYNVTRIAAIGSAGPLAGPVTLTNCSGPTDVVVAAETAAGQPVQFFYLANQTYVDQQAVDLTAQLYTAAIPRDYSYTTVPAGANNFNLIDLLKAPHGLAYAAHGGIATLGTTTTETLSLPTFNGATDVVLAGFQTNAMTQHSFLDWGPPVTPFTTDVGARMMHEFTSYPSQSITTPSSITWTETTAGLAPDFMLAEVFTTRASGSRAWNWQYAGPYTAGTFTFPVLPTDVYDYNIGATDTSNFSTMLMGKVLGGYDAVRAHLFALFAGPQQFILGSTGSIAVEQPTQNNTLNARAALPMLWSMHAAKAKPVQVLRHRSD